MRIEICGNIASGKTTLANLILSLEIPVVLEDFKKNPFWKPFYSTPNKYNFETEITFLLQHYHSIKIAKKNHDHFSCDFSIYQDLAYAIMGLKNSKLQIFNDIFNEIINEIKRPDLLIHLECSESVLIDRIKNRGREEESNIDTNFLSVLNDKISETIYKNNSRILKIDSESLNFAINKKDREEVLRMIRTELLN